MDILEIEKGLEAACDRFTEALSSGNLRLFNNPDDDLGIEGTSQHISGAELRRLTKETRGMSERDRNIYFSDLALALSEQRSLPLDQVVVSVKKADIQARATECAWAALQDLQQLQSVISSSGSSGEVDTQTSIEFSQALDFPQAA